MSAMAPRSDSHLPDSHLPDIHPSGEYTAPQVLVTADRARDEQHFRRVLGNYPTGVTVVTAIGEGGDPQAMVVGSFTSVSLDPPLVAFLPSADSRSWAGLRKVGTFCVNILSGDQEHLCRQLASRTGDKYAGLTWSPSPSGSPIFEGAVAWIDCTTEVIHPAGDHDIVVGRVLDLDTASEDDPLLFFRGGYGGFTPHILIASDDHYASELDLVDRARHLLEGTAISLRGQVAVAHCDGDSLTVLATAGQDRDHRLPRAALGEAVALTAPIGIWWMSYAPPAAVASWLAPLEARQRDQVREALQLIRDDGGLTVGLASVHDGFGRLLVERAAGSRRSAAEEAVLVSALAVNPASFVASRFGPTDTAAQHPEVRSIWAPVLNRDEAVVLGVMVTGFPSDQPLAEVARAVRHLAQELGALARHDPTGRPGPVRHDNYQDQGATRPPKGDSRP